jgi:hypothetical protein
VEGRLDERGLPLLDIRLAGASAAIAVRIDTAFDGELLLYTDQVAGAGLDLVYRDMEMYRLADGTERPLPIALVPVDWHGRPRSTRVNVVPFAERPGARGLLGCGPLRDSRLTISFPDGLWRSGNSRAQVSPAFRLTARPAPHTVRRAAVHGTPTVPCGMDGRR